MKSSKRHKQTLEDKMIKALLRQKRKYEIYLNSKKTEVKTGDKTEEPELDHKAEHAYTHIIKTIVELSRKSQGREKEDPEEMKRIAEEILESEYGIKRN